MGEHDDNEKFEYLPYVMPYAIAIYVLLAVVTLLLYRRRLSQENYRGEEVVSWGDVRDHFVQGFSFEKVYLPGPLFTGFQDAQSSSGSASIPLVSNSKFHRKQRQGLYFLTLWRSISFLYFFSVALLWGYIHFHGNDAVFFTVWNIDIITLHYALLMSASWIGLIFDEDRREFELKQREFLAVKESFWSDSMQRFGFIVQIFYSFVGSTALFITLVAWTTLDHQFKLWNVSFHLLTSISFLVDMLINQMNIRAEHLIFSISWVMLYIVFIWIMVRLGACDWPYFFLHTDTPAVFVWYPGLFLLDVGFYYIWIYVNDHKVRLARFVWNMPQEIARDDEDIRFLSLNHSQDEEGLLPEGQ